LFARHWPLYGTSDKLRKKEDDMHTQDKWTFSNRIRTNLSSFVWIALLWVFTVAQVLGQQQYRAQSAASTSSAPTSATVREIAVTGTVEQLQNTHAGVHLLVDSEQGALNAHLGPSISAEIQGSLSAGEPVQMTGSFQTLDGQRYLLVHQLTAGGRTFTIRNDSGFPVRARSAKGSPLSGGAQ
jgi:hypothetical protein